MALRSFTDEEMMLLQELITEYRNRVHRQGPYIPEPEDPILEDLLNQSDIRMIHGSLIEDLASIDESFEINTIYAIFGSNPADEAGTGTGTDDALIIFNSHAFSGDTGNRVDAVYCNAEERWEDIQVTCPSEE